MNVIRLIVFIYFWIGFGVVIGICQAFILIHIISFMKGLSTEEYNNVLFFFIVGVSSGVGALLAKKWVDFLIKLTNKN